MLNNFLCLMLGLVMAATMAFTAFFLADLCAVSIVPWLNLPYRKYLDWFVYLFVIMPAMLGIAYVFKRISTLLD